MSETTKDMIEYVPFGSEAAIKLSLNIVKNYICIPTKSGKLCSDRDAMRFMMLCRSRALNPFEGDAFLQGYDGKNGPEFSLITAHQAFLKRAEYHPEFDGMESGVIVKRGDKILDLEGDFTLEEDELLGGWATVHFKTRKHPIKRRSKLTTFNKGYGRWEVDSAGMIVKCAEADALRSAFPTKLGGLYMREEVQVRTDPVSNPMIDLPQQANGQQDPPKAQEQTAQTNEAANNELEAIVTGAGYKLDDLLRWGQETNNIPDAMSIPSFDAIPGAIQKRLCKAKAGLLAGLKSTKAVDV